MATRIEAARRQVGLRDVAAIVVLVLATWHLVGQNGGREARDMLWVLAVGVAGVIVLAPTLRSTSRVVVWLFATWSLAPIIVLLDAEIRAGAVRPLSSLALAPAVALAAIHLWRRPWGPAALGAILAITAARSWYLTFLAWWGGALGRPTWMALSWHNQSGTLMGALGVAATATAAVLRGRAPARDDANRGVRAAIVMACGLAGATLAGTWLSGSRGALIATVVGLAAVLVGLARGGELRRAVPALAGVVLATTIAVVGLEAMVQSDAGPPMATREQTAAQNMSARLGYWRAAVGMATTRPLTGWGPGSYRWASVPYYPDDTTLTSSAHNEYLEAMAENGLVGAAPVWFAALAAAILAAAVILRRAGHGQATGRRAGALAAAGAVAVLGVHAAIDFDWDYPLLLALFALAVAVLWADRWERRTRGPLGSTAIGRVPVLVATGSVLLLLSVATAAAALTTRARTPWELNRSLVGALTAADTGDIRGARAHMATARSWNPGAPSVAVVGAVVEHRAGALTDASLAAMVDPRTTAHEDQLLVAHRLLEGGNPAAARDVVDDLAPVLDARRRWGVRAMVMDVAALQLRTEAVLSDCDAAAALVVPAREWVESFGVPAATFEELLSFVSGETGCDLQRSGT